MQLEAIKNSIHHALRRRVTLCLTNGDRVEIFHPDFVAYSPLPEEPEFIVWGAGGGGRYNLLTAAEVARVEVAEVVRPVAGEGTR